MSAPFVVIRKIAGMMNVRPVAVSRTKKRQTVTKKISVYLASAYTKGDVAQNINKAICIADILADGGFIPYIPILTHFWHLVSPHPYEFWIDYDAQLLPMFDCVLRIPGESAGADREVAQAIECGIPVFYTISDLREFYNGYE